LKNTAFTGENMPNCAELVPYIDKLSGVTALVVGDAMLDHYVIGTVDRVSPEAPVPILRVTDEFNRVGGAANVAANITSLKGRANLLALAGRGGKLDNDGQILAQKCADRDINVELIADLPCTVRKARMVADRQQMLRVDWEYPYSSRDNHGKFELSERAIEIRGKVLADLLDDCDVILVSDYAKGMVDANLMNLLRESGKPVIVDPRPQHKEIYRGVSLITPNRKEATEMLGAHGYLPGCELGHKLAEMLECDVLVTLGEEGMCLCCRGAEPVSIATRAREVFDVTGAGDTVAATFALAVGAGCTMAEAAHIANAAAGVVVGHVGCVSVDPESLKEALLSKPEK